MTNVSNRVCMSLFYIFPIFFCNFLIFYFYFCYFLNCMFYTFTTVQNSMSECLNTYDRNVSSQRFHIIMYSSSSLSLSFVVDVTVLLVAIVVITNFVVVVFVVFVVIVIFCFSQNQQNVCSFIRYKTHIIQLQMYVRLLNYSCVIYGRSRLAKASGRCTIQTSSRAINTKNTNNIQYIHSNVQNLRTSLAYIILQLLCNTYQQRSLEEFYTLLSCPIHPSNHLVSIP